MVGWSVDLHLHLYLFRRSQTKWLIGWLIFIFIFISFAGARRDGALGELLLDRLPAFRDCRPRGSLPLPLPGPRRGGSRRRHRHRRAADGNVVIKLIVSLLLSI